MGVGVCRGGERGVFLHSSSCQHAHLPIEWIPLAAWWSVVWDFLERAAIEGKTSPKREEKAKFKNHCKTAYRLCQVVTQCWEDQWVINVWPLHLLSESIAKAGYSMCLTKLDFFWYFLWKKCLENEDQWFINVWPLHLLSHRESHFT